MAELATAWAMYSSRSSLYRNGIYASTQADPGRDLAT